jgi:hypothetical protein
MRRVCEEHSVFRHPFPVPFLGHLFEPRDLDYFDVSIVTRSGRVPRRISSREPYVGNVPRLILTVGLDDPGAEVTSLTNIW